MPLSRFPIPQGALDMLISQIVSLDTVMFRSIARVVVPVGLVSVSVLASLANAQNLAEPAQSDRGAESADGDDIHFSEQYAGQNHEGGGRNAGIQIQLPANQGRSLVC